MVLASFAAFTLVLALALRFRGRLYATFTAVVLGIHTLASVAMFPSLEQFAPAFLWLQVAVYVHFISLIWARMRPASWRYLISLPAHYFVGATFLAIPWAAVAAVGFDPWVPWVPYAIGLLGVVQSSGSRESTVDLVLDGQTVDAVEPRPHRTPVPEDGRPLRLFQITDTHLGPFMPVRRLRRICARAVARKPDLVLITGDLLTMESNQASEALAAALEPLRALEGRVFACRGNHDLEAPDTVERALAAVGVRLLVDESVLVKTEAGPVQIIGIDYRFRNRRKHLESVCRRHPRVSGALRLVLLHDPGAFRLMPEGEGDLVLSGHTHGGQVGLVSLGLGWTMLRAFTRMPDHGIWARGRDRLYVHRGTGHYGFPLRLGVPSERSILRVHSRLGDDGFRDVVTLP